MKEKDDQLQKRHYPEGFGLGRCKAILRPVECYLHTIEQLSWANMWAAGSIITQWSRTKIFAMFLLVLCLRVQWRTSSIHVPYTGIQRITPFPTTYVASRR